MKKGISVWAIKGQAEKSAKEIFKAVKKAGFDGIELAVDATGILTPDSTQKDCECLLEEAQAAGVEILSVAGGMGWGHSMTSDDTAERNRSKKMYRKSLRLASWLGVDALLVLPGRVHATFVDSGPVHVPYDVCYKRAKAGIKSLAKTAQESKVNIGIENVWNMFLLSPLEMRDFIDEIKSRWVGCYFDVGNVIISGFSEDWVNILGKRIKAVHIKDFKRSVATLSGFCDLLDGDVDFKAVMPALTKAGYKGAYVAEFFDQDARGLRKISGRMDKILKMA